MNPLYVLYDKLDFKNGGLYSATDTPSECRNLNDWLEKGEWLTAAKRVGADKIFFVENNPVIIFAECGAELEEKVKAFNRSWCLARPRLLFLSSPGEITVYDLAKKPIDENKPKDWKNLKSLAILHDIAKVSQKLQMFHRDNVESGRVFEDQRFGDLNNRADKSLIRDLKTVRQELLDAGLSDEHTRFAHALIGRSIFIRYLEDRGILTENYFLEVARQKDGWTDLLRNHVSKEGFNFSDHKTFYPKVLADKGFTYALFRKLAKDFNGDMFPDVDEEEQIVVQNHLILIQNLLYGDAGIQKKLFFYSYRFDLVPLDLISSIYEEFYHGSTSDDEKNSKARQAGAAYYTPSVLVEFVLSRILTPDILKNTPRVMDPACGSGIFLVEAFRRIVRYKWHEKKQPLTFEELKNILQDQLAGIEVNEEAARITAFSLYLTMLHYLDPPAIDRQIKMGNRLPNLVATTNRSANHFHCIFPGNAFDVRLIDSNTVWKKRFGKECADIIVGNPPWGSPGTKASEEIKARQKMQLDWCESNNKPIGDNEQSQAFLWRVLDLLKTNGKAGMLVSAGVLLKHNTTSQSFRKQWFDCVRLDEVFNFSRVRQFFFKGVSSPFLSVIFRKEVQNDKPVLYWSAKQYEVVKKVQSIMLSKNDLRIIRGQDLSNYRTWKIYIDGSYKDRDFLAYLDNSPQTVPLEEKTLFSCVGFKKANQQKEAGWLADYKKIKKEAFSRYDEIKKIDFETVPSKVEHRGRGKEIYEGHRIIIKEGPMQTDGNFGRIEARYETVPYAFNHSFHVIKLIGDESWKYRVLIGILWSSFAKYYLFLTSSSWGVWHDKVLVNERLKLPVVFDKNNPFTSKIITIVDKLRNYHPQKRDLFNPDGTPVKEIVARHRELESDLDEAVFELYGLNEEQIDLIQDFCNVTLPFFYKPFDNIGAKQAIEEGDSSCIEKYVHIFCRRWNPYLGENEEMRAEVHIGANGNMVALEFYPADRADPYDLTIKDDTWGYILEQIGDVMPQSMGVSQIVLDGLVHVVLDSGIIIIKRNEKRFWTRSLAREDADAALCKRMADTMPKARSAS